MNALFTLDGRVLKTKRLVLRPFRKTDLNDFFEYASVDGVGEMAGWKHHENIGLSQTILDIFIREDKVFAIEKDGKIIGSLGVENYKEELFPELDNLYGREIGFVLSKDYWGQGLMKEACEALIDYLFTYEKLDFILCGHFIKNNQSRRVQEKLGFLPYKRINLKTRMNTIEDTMMNILLKKGYKR